MHEGALSLEEDPDSGSSIAAIPSTAQQKAISYSPKRGESVKSVHKSNLRAEKSEPQCSCAHVLLVDDEPFNLIALEGLIAKIGPEIRVEKAFNGEEALQRIEQSFNN